MAIVKDDYEPLSADDIYDNLVSNIQSELDEDADVTEGSFLNSLLRAHANALANNQEDTLDDIYDAGYLSLASGEDLDNVVEIIGIERRSAVHATGWARFTRDTPPTQEYVISSGTTVQTEGDEPVKFDTQSKESIKLLEDFESGSLPGEFENDTGKASVVDGSASGDPSPYEGSYELKLAGTSGGASIYRTDESFDLGDTGTARVHIPTAGGEASILFTVFDADQWYQIDIDDGAGEVEWKVNDSGTMRSLGTASLSVPLDDWMFVDLDTTTDGDITVSIDNEAGTELLAPTTFNIVEDNANIDEIGWHEGGYGFGVEDADSDVYFDKVTRDGVAVTIREQDGGALGNVGANTVTNMPNPPSGVDGVTNLDPTGDSDFFEVDGDSLVVGRDEEDDDALRERADLTLTKGGAATHDAIASALINDDELSVQSVTIFENKTNTDNTGSGGLPEFSMEVVVFGGDEQSIAEVIFDTKAVTGRDYGGANGSAVTRTVHSDVTDQDVDITYSRPTELAIDLSLDIVKNDEYIGDDALRDEIIDYIGGTDSGGNSVIGTGVGEDVKFDEIERIVNGADGVEGISSLSSTPSSTTDANGLTVVDVGGNEVGVTDGTDGSISITKTSV